MTVTNTLFLVRHGHVGADHLRRYLGRTDWPLSSEGQAQAEQLRQHLAAVAFDRIIASDRMRSRQTAGCIAKGRPLPLETIPALNEIDLGAWETLTPQQVREQFDADSRARDTNLFDHRPPMGESFADLSLRVLPVFERIVRQARGHILIAGHAGVNRIILCRVLGMPPQHLFRLGQDYGALNCIELRPSGLRVTALNLPPAGPCWSR